jgi:hypothetical protein
MHTDMVYCGLRAAVTIQGFKNLSKDKMFEILMYRYEHKA